MEYSFEKAFDRVPRGEANDVKTEIKQSLNITSRPQWLNRLRGKVEPKVSEAKAIEEIFAKRGITEIWGS